MVKNTSVNLDVTVNVDGYTLIAGSTDKASLRMNATTNGDALELVTGFTGAQSLTLPAVASGTVALLSDIYVSIAWSEEAAGLTMVADHGYMYTGGGASNFALPATAAQFTVIRLLLKTAGIATITQAAGQQIQIGNSSTTLGAGGSLASTSSGDALYLLCTTADTSWTALSSVGSFTVV